MNGRPGPGSHGNGSPGIILLEVTVFHNGIFIDGITWVFTDGIILHVRAVPEH